MAQRRDRKVTGAREPATECDPGHPSAPQIVASLSADESTRRRIDLAGCPLGAPKERGSVDEQEEELKKFAWVFVPKEKETRSITAETRMKLLAIQVRC